MAIHKSRETNCMVAQCDVCFDIVEFEDLDGSDSDNWSEAKLRIDMDGWKTKKDDAGKWVNICVDCING